VTPLTLQLRERPAQRVDMSPFTPDRLAGMTPDAIGRIALWQGNRQVPAGDLFRVNGTDCADIRIQSDSDRLDWIGAGMTQGGIRVEGHAGAYLGRAMRGGAIRISGGAGPFAGSGLSGGSLRIDGNCGDFLGAPIPGERQGMRGGLIEVRGDAGDRAGDRLRRGTILIAGKAGDYCASRMIAGTIACLGGAGAQAGLAMRRGTLLLASAPVLPPTFNDNGHQDLGVLALLTAALRHLDPPFCELHGRGTRVHRWLGDLGYGGRGEVLCWI
jgi:formylmethanofuran dehydrogenase subunit C